MRQTRSRCPGRCSTTGRRRLVLGGTQAFQHGALDLGQPALVGQLHAGQVLQIEGVDRTLAVGRDMRRAAAEVEAVERLGDRSEEHTSELQSLMRISYAVFCL